MKTIEINGEVVVLQHVVNVSKIFTGKDGSHSLNIKSVGRESGFIFNFSTVEEAETVRADVLKAIDKA